MFFKINPEFNSYKTDLIEAFQNFDTSGKEYINGERNRIKLFDIYETSINIKSFKIPNKINQFIYRYIRPSKAKRSFEYAQKLTQKGIGTPTPIAYYEKFGGLGLKRSYYASIHQAYDLTYRELVEVKDYPEEEKILRQFTRFCYKMHEEGIEFKDHSPGNTLIRKVDLDNYEFFLVDLNRMNFHKNMDIELRMKNLSRLTPKKEMVEVMAEEYALVSGENPDKLFDLLWNFTSIFQEKYHRKQRAKKKLKSLIK